MLEELNRINFLFDFYGALLTKHQQEVLTFYFYDNLSLGEIALEYKISRQAVHDIIHRALASLEKLEDKLSLYSSFKEQQKLLTEAEAILSGIENKSINLLRLQEIVAALRLMSEK